MHLVSEGLAFPEAPVVVGSEVLVAEIAPGCITSVIPHKRVVCQTRGGPNGLALGPDRLLYVCNNGGLDFRSTDGITEPVGLSQASIGGRIQTADPATGVVEDLYASCEGDALGAPNDLVFDRFGDFYFTDALLGAVFIADPSGRRVARVGSGLQMPNGIGLSPDGATLYVAETYSGRLVAFEVGKGPTSSEPREIYSSAGAHGFDSLAIDVEGNICVATLRQSAITVLRPDGSVHSRVAIPEFDPYVTNICFGGDGLETAYITSAGLGRVYATAWHCPGLALHGA